MNEPEAPPLKKAIKPYKIRRVGVTALLPSFDKHFGKHNKNGLRHKP